MLETMLFIFSALLCLFTCITNILFEGIEEKIEMEYKALWKDYRQFLQELNSEMEDKE